VEWLIGSDPWNSTSDGSGESDRYKVPGRLWWAREGTNQDPDGDGLPDFLESLFGSNPNDHDSDDDGKWDGSEDHDGDGAATHIELSCGLNPNDPSDASADDDGDGLMNWHELVRVFDPQNPDTDGDGVPDGWEFYHGTLVMNADANQDYDEDGLRNITEFLLDLDPFTAEQNAHDLYLAYLAQFNDGEADNDFDGLPDVLEVMCNLSPFVADDGDTDNDNDGLPLRVELLLGTDFLDYDSDDDGIPDGAEDNDNDGMPTLGSSSMAWTRRSTMPLSMPIKMACSMTRSGSTRPTQTERIPMGMASMTKSRWTRDAARLIPTAIPARQLSSFARPFTRWARMLAPDKSS
jgi:hypothetical protein